MGEAGSSTAGDGMPDAPGRAASDFETEVARATSPFDAAHRLAYMDAVYHIVNGDYLVSSVRC